MECSLRRLHSPRTVVDTGKEDPQQFSEIEGGSAGPEMLRAPSQDYPCSNRQHYVCYL